TRAIAYGLAYVLVWESLLANFVSGARLLSVGQYSLGVANGIAHDAALNAGLSLGTSAIMGAIVTAAGLIVAARALASVPLKGGGVEARGSGPPGTPRWLGAPAAPAGGHQPSRLARRSCWPWGDPLDPPWPCGPALPRRRRAGAEGGAVPGDDHAGDGEDPPAAAPQRRPRGGQRMLGRAVRPAPSVGAR